MDTIFISWSQETRQVADAINQWISARCDNARGWIADVDIIAGQRWRSEIDKALTAAQCSLACVGPSAISSSWVMYEAGAIAASKAIIPIALLVPHGKLPSILSEIQILNAFEVDSINANKKFPEHLAKALSECLPGSAFNANDMADNRLFSAINDFAVKRKRYLLSLLRSTNKADSLTKILRYIVEHPNLKPSELADNGVLKDVLGKKFLVALGVFWLKEQGFISVDDFDDMTAGKVNISLSGRLVLKR
jgi:hypothetical protein